MNLSTAIDTAVAQAGEHNASVFVLQNQTGFYTLASMHMQGNLSRQVVAVIHPQPADLDTLHLRISQIETDRDHEKDANRAARESYEAQIRRLNEEIKSEVTVKEALERGNQALRDDNTASASRCNKLQDEIAEREQSFQTVNKAMHQAEEEKQTLLSQNRRLLDENNHIREERSDIERKLDEAEGRLNELARFLENDSTDMTWRGTEYKCFEEDDLNKAIETSQENNS